MRGREKRTNFSPPLGWAKKGFEGVVYAQAIVSPLAVAVAFVLLLAVVATGGWFQAPEPTQNQVPAPTIRVSTHLVLVDVVVTDKQGKPIAGLHPEDFELQENGKAQKISTFVPAGENLAAVAAFASWHLFEQTAISFAGRAHNGDAA